jgi:hypothetical protein
VLEGATVKLAGVTASETRVGGLTVSTADPLMEPEVAVIVAMPTATALATPAALIVATLAAEEDQATEVVRLDVVPLL